MGDALAFLGGIVSLLLHPRHPLRFLCFPVVQIDVELWRVAVRRSICVSYTGAEQTSRMPHTRTCRPTALLFIALSSSPCLVFRPPTAYGQRHPSLPTPLFSPFTPIPTTRIPHPGTFYNVDVGCWIPGTRYIIYCAAAVPGMGYWQCPLYSVTSRIPHSASHMTFNDRRFSP